jgi:glycosyltransferase involved in cell wall biosynthesis
MKTCAVILPVHNEASFLPKLLDALQATLAGIGDWSFEIICVDDGSTDGTGEVLRERTGITVLSHSLNRGYGAALKSALAYSNQEWALIMDADGSYPVESIPQFLEDLVPGTAMVVGERQGIATQENFPRRTARRMLRHFVHFLTSIQVTDLNSGMRLFRRELYREFLPLFPEGFSFTSTLTVGCLFRGYPIRFLPIPYGKREGRSHIRPVPDFFRFALLLTRVGIYFEPLRVFLGFAGALLSFGLACLVACWLSGVSPGPVFLLSVVGSLQCLLTGLVADLFVRRIRMSQLRVNPS